MPFPESSESVFKTDTSYTVLVKLH